MTRPSPEPLQAEELAALVGRVFRPRSTDSAMAILVDLPDQRVPDNPRWRMRREMAASWANELALRRSTTGLDVHLVLYRNVAANNADLPSSAWPHSGDLHVATAEELDASKAQPFEEILAAHSIVLAPTEFSTTAPLKLCAKKLGFRAATMPGFSVEMVPALRLDYGEISRRVNFLKRLLDRAQTADLAFLVDGTRECHLRLDLRHRTAHASGGLLTEPGTAGNLPSGEAYIVPYEGERPGVPSRSEGDLPVQLGSEVVVYRIERNVATRVEGTGPQAKREAEHLVDVPAYGNIAELGFGVLDEFGVQPVGEILLDEKLGLHIAFGRSDHFGGQVGAAQFPRPDAVVHIDRVYVAAVQPRIKVEKVDLAMDDGSVVALMRDGRYAVDFAQ